MHHTRPLEKKSQRDCDHSAQGMRAERLPWALLMIEQKLLGVDRSPDNVLVTLLFVRLEIGFRILFWRSFAKIIQGQFQFLRLGLAGVNRGIKLADFDSIFPLCVL